MCAICSVRESYRPNPVMGKPFSGHFADFFGSSAVV
jgi:hypothetical protein